MNPNDLSALKAAFNGLVNTYRRLDGFSEPVSRLESGFNGLDPQDLLKAAAGHATAAAALAGFVRHLVTRETGQVVDASPSVGPDKESEEQR
jgi:hypothetical protein